MERDEESRQSTEEIALRIGESTHELSNSVGAATALMQLAIRQERNYFVPDGFIQATEILSHANGELRKVMWELQKLYLLLRRSGKDSDISPRRPAGEQRH